MDWLLLCLERAEEPVPEDELDPRDLLIKRPNAGGQSRPSPRGRGEEEA